MTNHFFFQDTTEVVRRLSRWLEDVNYRPGWELEIRSRLGEVSLEVRALVLDSRRPEHQIVVTHVQPVWPNIVDRDMFLRWLRDALHRVEVHESDEWLRWSTGSERDQPVFDPHRPRSGS